VNDEETDGRFVTSRRHLLTKAGAAAVAAAGGTALLADPASGADLQVVYLPFGPERVYDSRLAGGRLSANQERTLGGAAFPDEFAHMYNLTITDTRGAGGFLSLFPGDISWPGSSSINWFGPGQTLANNAYSWLSDDDQQSVRVRAGGPTGSSTHFVLDLAAILVVIDLGFSAAEARRGARAGGSSRRLEAIDG
jgi:hypothetical protein